jgi:hypothetical protein
MECIGTPELIKEWNRLTGHSMGKRRDGITLAIDKACGYDQDEAAIPDFVDFVYEYIWLPLLCVGVEQ